LPYLKPQVSKTVVWYNLFPLLPILGQTPLSYLKASLPFRKKEYEKPPDKRVENPSMRKEQVQL
jgi:hypothetical protein